MLGSQDESRIPSKQHMIHLFKDSMSFLPFIAAWVWCYVREFLDDDFGLVVAFAEFTITCTEGQVSLICLPTVPVKTWN